MVRFRNIFLLFAISGVVLVLECGIGVVHGEVINSSLIQSHLKSV